MNSRTLVDRITQRARDYVMLIKPRITLLSLVTTFSGMWLAAPGVLKNRFVIFILLGTALGASSASTLNNFFDRNLDQLMSRTRKRPLPDHRIPASHALVIGLISGILGVAFLFIFANLTAALLLLFSICFYNGVYTLWVKHTSRFSTEISGVAGALAPVIGWVSVTGTLDPAAAILFAIMFVWQPAHFWALGIKYVDDYRRANLPRYPVVKGIPATKTRMLIYTCLLVPISLSLYLTGTVGLFYFFSALLLGIGYLGMTLNYVAKPINRARTLALFGSSILYLFLLFVSIFISTGLKPSV